MTIEVNGERISPDDISEEMRRLHPDPELSVEQRIELRETAVESLIDRILLFQEAHRLQLLPDESEIREACIRVAPRMDGVSGCRAGTKIGELSKNVERKLVIDRLIECWCRAVKPPKFSEIQAFYRKHRDQFWTDEMVCVSQVVRHTEGRNAEEERGAVEAMRQRLVSGEPFEDVAARYSDCPENGGDLGYFPRGVMVEEFDAVVFTARLNELTPVFQTRFGFHVAFPRDRKSAGIRSLNEVTPQIADILFLQKKDDEVGRRLDLLRRNASILRSA